MRAIVLGLGLGSGRVVSWWVRSPEQSGTSSSVELLPAARDILGKTHRIRILGKE